jgi:transcriptional regulator with XRE-family HTH domain
MIRAMPAPTTRTRNRPSLAEEDRDLAIQVGVRLKAARTRAAMTQRELAEPRYTKAYVSALEHGLIKPSMAALRYLAHRLGTVPEAFLADQDTQWERLDAELRLAAGDWQAAADRFQSILDTGVGGVSRGMALLGLAEATFRIGDGRRVIAQATEARELLAAAGRPADAARATYWLAAGHHTTEDTARARMLYEELLASGGSGGDPELRVRVLIALAAVVTYAGEPATSIALLEEARGIGADLDDRRRATLLHSLAQTYRISGDLEGAVRNGIESLGLFRAIDARGEAAMTDNELALTYLALGNLDEADRHASAARDQLERLDDRFRLSNVCDTQARIALARGDLAAAEREATEAARLADGTSNAKGVVDALLTLARVARRQGRTDDAIDALARAEAGAAGSPPARLRQILTEWSEIAAEAGDHAAAYELTRRALALG